jgi:outer membrane protein TolC
MRIRAFTLFLIVNSLLTFGFSLFLPKCNASEPPLSTESQSDQQPTWRLQKAMVKEVDRSWDQLKKELNGDIKTRLSLKEAIQLGLQNNPSLAVTFSQLQGSKWSGIAIQREWLPAITVNNPNPDMVGVGDSRKSTSVNGSSGSTNNTTSINRLTSSPRVQLNWTFLDPTRMPRSKASTAEIKAKEFLFDISARNLVLDIQNSYFLLQQKLQLVEAYEKVYMKTRAQVGVALNLFKKGSGSQGNIDQLRSQQLQQLSQLIQLNEQVSSSAYQLAYALSLEPGSLVFPSEGQAVQGRWDTPLQSSINHAINFREEISALLSTADGLKWASKSLLNRYLPVVSIFGQSNYRTDSYSSNQSGDSTSNTTGDTNEFRNNIGLNLNWQLFDGGINAAKARSSQEESSATLSKASLERYAVTLQVQNSFATYKTSLVEIKTAVAQLDQAGKALEATIKSYGVMPAAATTYIQNTQAYLNAITTYSQAVRRHNTSISSLYRYSAIWPEDSYLPLQERVKSLQQTPIN